MKTIHDMALVKKIWDNPLETIGQRDNRLFEAYCMPFGYCRKIENEHILEKYLEKYPSIYEEIEQDFKLRLGTAAWTRPLGYISEDYRELYDRSMKYIFAYEEKYPNPNDLDINYILNEEMSHHDLKNILGSIGYRPQMYFGEVDFGCVRAYIDGYFALKVQYKLNQSDFEKQLQSFINKYKNKETEYHQTWDRNYRWEWDFEAFGRSGQHTISRFLHDLEKFTGEKLRPTINDKEVNIDWQSYWPTYPRIEF